MLAITRRRGGRRRQRRVVPPKRAAPSEEAARASRQPGSADGLLRSSVTRRMRSEGLTLAHGHRAPRELAGGGESERVGDGLGSWPHRWCSPRHARGRAACDADQRARRRRRAVCRGRDGRWGRVARRWLGRTLRRRTSEDRESSTRCRQSLEEAQAAMLSSGSLHFGSPRVQPGFPIRPSARSSEVPPFLPASAVVRLPHA
jgi:hypothetical protein